MEKKITIQKGDKVAFMPNSPRVHDTEWFVEDALEYGEIYTVSDKEGASTIYLEGKLYGHGIEHFEHI